MSNITVEAIVGAYANEISNWDFYSDPQRAGMDQGRIVVCLRDYNWYITKEAITDPLVAVKALFEITWLSEFDGDREDGIMPWIAFSDYWEAL